MSQFHSLSDDEVFDSLQNEANFVRACPIGNSTKFAVLGVPAESIYSNPLRISVITELLKGVGLMPVLYGSASCDEVHIYLFFSELQKTKLITQALTNLLTNCGLKVAPENLIVYGEDQQLALPLQQGFSWLNDTLQPKVCRNEIAFESALYMFMSDISKNSSLVEQLMNFQTSVRTTVVTQIVDCQEDFTPPEQEVTLINQEPEKLQISVLEETIAQPLLDQTTHTEELLIIHIDQSTPAEIEDESGLVSVPISTVSKSNRTVPDSEVFAQLTLPVLADQSANTEQGNKRRSKNRRRKRGPPDM